MKNLIKSIFNILSYEFDKELTQYSGNGKKYIYIEKRIIWKYKYLLLSKYLYLRLLLMISFSCSSYEIDEGSASLRRSDRKRTKKIFKEDLCVRSALKHYQRSYKKHKSLFINENIPSYIPLYSQYPTHQLTNLLLTKTFQTNLYALRYMRYAVNRQQIKYGYLMYTKIVMEVNKGKYRQEKCLSYIIRYGDSCKYYKEEMLIDEYDMERGSEMSYDDCDRELVRMVTGTDAIHLQFYCMRLGGNYYHKEEAYDYYTFDDIYCHELYLSYIVPCRKYSAIMLSDDYYSNYLTYTMEQLQPKWLREENIYHVDW